jgi:hypothetical protein
MYADENTFFKKKSVVNAHNIQKDEVEKDEADKEDKTAMLDPDEQALQTQAVVREGLYLGERTLHHIAIHRTFLPDDEKKKLFNNCFKIEDLTEYYDGVQIKVKRINQFNNFPKEKNDFPGLKEFDGSFESDDELPDLEEI